jgi:predicted ATP-dependent endonuclease of OLD family
LQHAEEAAKWDSEHAATHNTDAAVSAAIKDVLKVEGNDARNSAGIKAYQQVLKNIAHYMEHMLYEETVLTPIFNSKMTDAQIEEVEQRLQAAVSPAFRQAITPYFLKAHNSHGRAFMLNMIKHTAPVPEIYAGVCGLAKSLLTAQEIQAVEKVLGYNLA